MIKYSELMIGDCVLVDGTPRKVEAITKKKIGYHRKENEPRLYYAMLRDVESIPQQGSLVRKQNERTLLLHSRIIQLSLLPT